MNKPHKHRDLIKAWADGAEIQFFNHFTRSWEDLNEPIWSDETQYRLKPEPPRYRVALCKYLNQFSTFSADNEIQANNVATSHGFVRWLTDWIEVEV